MVARTGVERTSADGVGSYWPSPDGEGTTEALALGLGSMFNHSRLGQNVTFSRDFATQCIVYTAHRDIEVGEELCISYGAGRLWFKDTDTAEDDPYEQLARHERDGKHEAALLFSGLGEIDLGMDEETKE